MSYIEAKKRYEALGVDVEKAMEVLSKVPVSLHCWQGDDVKGFDSVGPLTGGIQTTGNYPGAASNPEELIADMEKVFSLCHVRPMNLHANPYTAAAKSSPKMTISTVSLPFKIIQKATSNKYISLSPDSFFKQFTYSSTKIPESPCSPVLIYCLFTGK